MHSIPPLPAGELGASHVSVVTGHSPCATSSRHTTRGLCGPGGLPPGVVPCICAACGPYWAPHTRSWRTAGASVALLTPNRSWRCWGAAVPIVCPRAVCRFCFCRTGTYTGDAPSRSQTAPHSSIAITPHLYYSSLGLVAIGLS